jgi:hypothetical protein
VNYDDVVWNDDWNATLQVTEATTARSKNTLVNTATTYALVNFISFAFSDQPIEDRSKYIEKVHRKRLHAWLSGYS